MVAEYAHEERLNEDVPDSVLLKYVIAEKNQMEAEMMRLRQRIGENESYIEELEDKVKKLVNDEGKELTKQIKEQELYKAQRIQMARQDKKIQSLRKTVNELLMKLSNKEK